MSLQYLTIEETANELMVSTATVRNWIRAGLLSDCQRVGRRVMVSRDQVLAFKLEIERGQSARLKSRRNKKAVQTENLVPRNYTDVALYERLAAELVSTYRRLSTAPEVSLPLILLAVACNFGGQQKLIEAQAGRLQMQHVLNGNVKGNSAFLRTIRGLVPAAELPLQEGDWALLQEIMDRSIPFVEGEDFLGLVYMTLQNASTRQQAGAFYTPHSVATQLIQEALEQPRLHRRIRVIDPCCGSGNFLIGAFLHLRARLVSQGMARAVADNVLLTECIHGADIDALACVLAKVNLMLLVHDAETCPEPKVICTDSLSGWSFAGEAFDLVIGNPPWGSHFTPEELSRLAGTYRLATTGESFALFTELGFGLLKPGGLLAYVLPEAILNVALHTDVRRLLLQHRILHVHRLETTFSSVFTPAVTIACVKEPPAGSSFLVTNRGERYIVEQSRFTQNDGLVLNVWANGLEEQILKQLATTAGVTYLKGQADFALGIVTGDNKKFLLPHPQDGAERVLKGQDIYMYTFTPGSSYLHFSPALFQQVAPERFYRAPEKLLYRFICDSLVFAYDSNATLSLNSANILIPRIPGVSVKCVLAYLNSSVAQFYHRFAFKSVKVLRKHLESLPIPAPSPSQQARIVALAEEIMGAADDRQRLALLRAIDAEFFDLFRLSEQQRNLIVDKVGVPKFLCRGE